MVAVIVVLIVAGTLMLVSGISDLREGIYYTGMSGVHVGFWIATGLILICTGITTLFW